MFAIIKVDTADVHVMWVAFEEADVDDSGELTIGESLNYFGIDYTPFARRVFALMDDDHSVRAPRRLAPRSRLWSWRRRVPFPAFWSPKADPWDFVS